MELLFMQYFSSPITASLSGSYSPQKPVLQIPKLVFLLLSDPHKQKTGKIIALYNLIFTAFGRR
jgi:hypothetical protein